MDIKIKSMSYEECRENFFVNLIRHAENKIKYWKRQTGYRCELADNLSQAGAEIQYCQDALAALEKQIPKKINEYNRCPCCDTYNEVIEKRITRAYEEIKEVNSYDYLLINDDLDRAVDDFHSIVLGEGLKVKRNQKFIDEVYKKC